MREWWWRRQGLDGSLAGKGPAEVLEQSGWARSVGGVSPYLTFFSRAGLRREQVDKAVADLAVCELPSARGCTYVIPKQDFALALHAGYAFIDDDMRAAEKLGVTEKEIEKLCGEIVKALRKGPMDPEEIREATGAASRNLGEKGKKKGMTTTLPLALGRLQAFGEIRRIPVNGRLDQQRYRYALWRPNPLDRFKLTPQEVHFEFAKRYFKWTSPASLSEFQWFSGLSMKDIRAAVEPLNLTTVESGSPFWIPAEDLDAMRSFKAPSKPQYSLVGSMDSLFLLRRDVRSFLHPDDYERPVLKEKEVAPAGSLKDLPSHAILDRGRVIGLWEYDVENRSIAWASFGIQNKALNAAIEKTEQFVRNDLGDARSFSLDSPKSRQPRIAALRLQSAKKAIQ